MNEPKLPEERKSNSIHTLLQAGFLVVFLLGLCFPSTVYAEAAGNSSQIPTTATSANLNLTTGAIVAFILLILGLVASLLLLGRYLNHGGGS